MLHYKQNRWQLCTHCITVTEHGERRTLTTGDLQWWQDFAQKWSHVTIDDVQELTITDNQLIRYEHVKYLPEDFGHLYAHYVEFGEILEDVELLPQHPFNIVILKHREVVQIRNKSDELETTLDSVLTELIPSLLG